MATILDVAVKANVSVITVSRLLNNPDIVSSATSEKIFKVMDELNYQPSQIARSLVKKKTNTIGVIMPDIKNTFFNNWFRHVEDFASAHQYNLLLCNTDEEPAKELKYIKLFQAQRVDGVIIVPCSRKSVEYLVKSNLRFILVDRSFEGLKTEFIVTDHYTGAFEATEYLIKLGHKKIALLKGDGELYPDVERYHGFEDAMKKHSIKIEKEFICDCGFDDLKSYSAVTSLLKKENHPSAIFSFNSLMMVGAIRAIQNLHLEIPEQISLLSFDEIPGYNIFQPKITCVIQPVEPLGHDAAKLLIDRIKNPESPKQKKIYLKPKLVIGNSCKRI